MRRVVITHVGTSALACAAMFWNTPKDEQDHRKQTFATLWKREMPTNAEGKKLNDAQLIFEAVRADPLFEEASKEFEHGLRAVWRAVPHDEAQKGRQSSAETNSLQQLKLQSGDRIVLACSDTYIGVFCGLLLERCLITTAENERENVLFRPNNLDVVVEILTGVDVMQGTEFIDAGLPAYMRLIAREVWDKDRMRPKIDDATRLILNVTGGFKGVVMFAVIAAQLLGTHPDWSVDVEVAYAHEESKRLITLAPLLPVDWRMINKIYGSICTLVEHPKSERAKNLPDDLHPYRQRDDRGSPNGLALCVYHLISDLGWL